MRQTGARILACVPATGDDLEPLLEQIGLTVSLRAERYGETSPEPSA